MNYKSHLYSSGAEKKTRPGKMKTKKGKNVSKKICLKAHLKGEVSTYFVKIKWMAHPKSHKISLHINKKP